MEKRPKKQEFHSDWICDDRPKPMSPEVAAMTEEEIEAEFQRLFGQYLPENAQTIIAQFEIHKYTVLLFENLKMYKSHFIEIEGERYKIVNSLDYPNGLAIEAKGNFIGKKVIFVN